MITRCLVLCLILSTAVTAGGSLLGPKALFHDPEIHPTIAEIKARSLADLRWETSPFDI